MSKQLKSGLLLLLYVWFCYLMLQITWQYIPINTDVAFLRIKQDYVRLKWYQIAFFTHVFGSIFVLLAGFTQFSEAIRINHYIVHRWSGWLYVAVVVGIAAPSGFLIGLCANGGWSAQLAFCLLAILWFIFTIIAVQKVLQKDITGHRRWMLRSFALAISAITLRAWKYILVALFHPRPMDVYRWVAWLGWVGNLLVVEWWIYRKEKSKM